MHGRLVDQSVCFCCFSAHESALHAIVSYEYSQQNWKGLHLPLSFLDAKVHNIVEWFQQYRQLLSQEQLNLAAVCAWAIWNERNAVLFRSYPTTVAIIVDKVKNIEMAY